MLSDAAGFRHDPTVISNDVLNFVKHKYWTFINEQ